MNAVTELVPFDRLAQIATGIEKSYLSAEPFPHVVLDDLFDPEVLRGVLEEFPGPYDIDWEKFWRGSEVKLGLRDESQLGPHTRRLLQELNSARFLRFLTRISGIEELLPDPYLEGAGLHQIMPGGRLAVHVDLARGRLVNLDRRLNLIVYLNENWNEGWGGRLELWNGDATRCEKRIAPVFNRTVIFTTTSTSFHGHPEPLTCPPGRSRKSLCLFYFTNGRPAGEETVPSHARYRLVGKRRRLRQFQERISQFLPPIFWHWRASLYHRLSRYDS